MTIRPSILLALVLFASCSGNDEPPPPPPTVVVIRAVDSVTDGPLADAWLRIDGAWRQTGADGSLQLELAPGEHTYVAMAAGHVIVPRVLDPVPSFTLAEAQTTEVRVLMDPRTGAQPVASIRGNVTRDGSPVAGALVTAIGVRSYAGYTDDAGDYVIPGLDVGSYIVRARMSGAEGTALPGVNVMAGADAEDVDLRLTSLAGVTVSGMIAGGTGTSSVVLLEPQTGRIVPGLSTLATLGDRYAIDGVPPGTYEVLGAYERDAWVMDPEAIREDGGLPEITVDDSDVTLDFGVAPTIDGVMPVGTSSSATPLFTWAPVANADYYVPELRDASGRVVWGGFDAAGRWTVRAIGTERLGYNGPALTEGLLYTFRVFAAMQDPVVPSNFDLLAGSELRAGHFRIRP